MRTGPASGSRSGPLAGLRVVDLTKFVSGPYATMLLADAGATVVKVEPPGGDTARWGEPLFPQAEGGMSATFLRMNRGKMSVESDLKTEEGRALLERLIVESDVLIENFRVGVLSRLGFDEERLASLNPRLVYASITGFGHTPSGFRDRPAFNLIAEYEAGVYHRGTGTPSPLGPYVGDLFPGMHALSGILMALYERSITGKGGRVDIAMFDSMLSFNEAAGSYEAWLGSEDAADTTRFYCPSGVYPCGDGHVCIDVVTEKQWDTMCALIDARELREDPYLATGADRAAHYDERLAPVLLPWLGQRSGAEIAELLSSHGVPAAVVRSPGEALTGVQAQERGMRLEVSVSAGVAPPTSEASRTGARSRATDGLTCVPETLPVAANPIRIGVGERPSAATVPLPGEHNETVFEHLAANADEIRPAT